MVAIGEGTVILTTWSPDDGYLVEVQHMGGLISFYRNMAQSLVEVGQKLTAGQIVGYSAEATDEGNTPRLLQFEIWSDGKPVDPESYIVF